MFHAGGATKAAPQQDFARTGNRKKPSGKRAGQRPRVGVQHVLPICTTCTKVGHKNTNCRWANTAAGKEIRKLQNELRKSKPQAAVAEIPVAAKPWSHSSGAADHAVMPFAAGMFTGRPLPPFKPHLGSNDQRFHLRSVAAVVHQQRQVTPVEYVPLKFEIDDSPPSSPMLVE